MSENKLEQVSVLWLMQRFAALGVTETFMCCIAGTYQIELGLDDGDHRRVILGVSSVDMIGAMGDLLVKLDAVDATRSTIRIADAADPDGAQPISTRSIMEIAADGCDPHAEFLHSEAEREGRAGTDGGVLIEGATMPHPDPFDVPPMADLEFTMTTADEAPDIERCSLCKEPAHPSETNDRGDHESCADAQRRGDDA